MATPAYDSHGTWIAANTSTFTDGTHVIPSGPNTCLFVFAGYGTTVADTNGDPQPTCIFDPAGAAIPMQPIFVKQLAAGSITGSMSAWMLRNPPSGTKTIRVTVFNGTGRDLNILSTAYTNCQGIRNADWAKAQSGDSPDLSIYCQSASSIVVGGACHGDSPISADGNQRDVNPAFTSFSLGCMVVMDTAAGAARSNVTLSANSSTNDHWVIMGWELVSSDDPPFMIVDTMDTGSAVSGTPQSSVSMTVAVDDLLVVCLAGDAGSQTNYCNLTKVSGTATIGTPTGAIQEDGASADRAAINTVRVTGAGTLVLGINIVAATASYVIYRVTNTLAKGWNRSNETSVLATAAPALDHIMTQQKSLVFYALASASITTGVAKNSTMQGQYSTQNGNYTSFAGFKNGPVAKGTINTSVAFQASANVDVVQLEIVDQGIYFVDDEVTQAPGSTWPSDASDAVSVTSTAGNFLVAHNTAGNTFVANVTGVSGGPSWTKDATADKDESNLVSISANSANNIGTAAYHATSTGNFTATVALDTAAPTATAVAELFGVTALGNKAGEGRSSDTGSGVAFTFTFVTASDNPALLLCVDDWTALDFSSGVTFGAINGITPVSADVFGIVSDATIASAGMVLYNDAGLAGSKTISIVRAATSIRPAIWVYELISDVSFITVPDAPTSVTATHGGYNAMEVKWTPGADGGAAITDYAIDYALASAPTTWLGPFSHTASALPVQYVTGLGTTNAYVFRVAAINSVGQGAWSSTSGSLTATDTRGQRLIMTGENVLTMASDLVLLMAGDVPPVSVLVQSFFFGFN